MPPRSPLAPAAFPPVASVAGVEIAGIASGLKRKKGAKDLMVARLAPGTAVAGVLTRSRCPSAPVDWCRGALSRGRARALVVNSGNANAFTGQAGADVVNETVTAAAKSFGCPRRQVLVASTGVIGVKVDAGHISGQLPAATARLSPNGWRDAAEAIRTTDTYAKAEQRKDADRRCRGDDLGHRQGLGHDRAGYGNHAGFLVHRRPHSGAGAEPTSGARGRSVVKLHHRGQRYLDLGYGVAVRYRQGPATRENRPCWRPD